MKKFKKEVSLAPEDVLSAIYRVEGIPAGRMVELVSFRKIPEGERMGGLLSRASASILDEERSFIRVDYPIELFELDFCHLISTVATNFFDVMKEGRVELLDLIIPNRLLSKFKGPSFGLEGIKRALASKGPVLGVVMRVSPGTLPASQARTFYEIAISGIDIGVDPLYLVNQDFSPIEARSSHFADMIDRVRGETGRRIIYAINVTSEHERVMDLAEKAVENGATALEIDVSSSGLSSLKKLSSEFGKKVPILATGIFETSYISMRGYVSGRVAALFARLLGADLVVRASVTRGEDVEGLKSIDNALKTELGKIAPSMPVASGEIYPGNLEANILSLGEDQVLMADEAIFFHPWGIKSGAKALREALDAIIRGEGVLVAAQAHGELKQALEKWGYGPA